MKFSSCLFIIVTLAHEILQSCLVVAVKYDAVVNLVCTESSVTTPHRWDLKGPPEIMPDPQKLPRKDTALPFIKLSITEPRDHVIVPMNKVFVKVDIWTPEEDLFQDFLTKTDTRICISLDESPFYCWEFENGKILFNSIDDGVHTIIAKMYVDGVLIDETASAINTFITVQQPDTFYDPKLTTRYSETKSHTIWVDEIDGRDIYMTYPIMRPTSPAEKVSYTGSNIAIETALHARDRDIFWNYFKNAFVCVNLDMAVGNACFPLFHTHKSFMVVGLGAGMHTINMSLSHPKNGDSLEGSNGEVIIFYMAGKSNEGAEFTTDINIRGKVHTIPIVKGGCIKEQAKAFCQSVGLSKNISTCMQPVLRHLEESAKQSGLVFHY